MACVRSCSWRGPTPRCAQNNLSLWSMCSTCVGPAASRPGESVALSIRDICKSSPVAISLVLKGVIAADLHCHDRPVSLMCCCLQGHVTEQNTSTSGRDSPALRSLSAQPMGHPSIMTVCAMSTRQSCTIILQGAAKISLLDKLHPTRREGCFMGLGRDLRRHGCSLQVLSLMSVSH